MSQGAFTPSRRQVLGMGLGLAAGSLARRPWAQAANFDWMQQKGKSIVVTAPLSPYYTVLQKMIPDFTKLTGIQVEYQVVPEQQLRQKLPIEMNAKSPGIDVFASSMHVEKILFSMAGWYEPLNKYLENANLTPPDYNWKDFGPAGTYWGLKGDGTIVAIPMGVGLVAYMYRKDLYAQKGLKPATTVDELIAAVKAPHKPPAVYGYAGRGLKNANIPVWGCLTIALGGDYLDKTKTQLLTTSPEAIEAAKIYAELMRTYAPPGSIGFNWMESQGAFTQGLVACWPDSIQFAAPFEDPTKSKVVGKVGYAPHPGSAKMKPFGGTAMDAIALNPFGKNKEAAWLFGAWASSRPVQWRMMFEGAMIGTRNSIYADPEFVKAHNMPQGLGRRGGRGAEESPAAAAGAAGREPVPRHLRRGPHEDDRGRGPQDASRAATKEFEPTFQKGLKS